MKRITKAEDTYFFAGSIIACEPTTPYYGNIENYKLFEDLIFTKVSSIAAEWKSNEIGLGMNIFSKPEAKVDDTALTTEALKKYGESYLNVRHATADEIKLLKELVINDKAKLAYSNKEETLKMLTKYLINGGLPPYPYVYIPVKEDEFMYWEKVDPYKNFERPKELEIIGKLDHTMSEL